MRKNVKIALSAVLSAAMLLSVSACSSNESGGVENDVTVTTNAQYTPLLEHVKTLTDKVDGSIKVEKKIRWLSHWPIDETQAACELFKEVYGIPELGDESYGNDANNIFDYLKVDYAARYDQLGKLVVSGQSPDIFQFEIINYPYTAWKNLFQPIDPYIDLSDPAWDATRDVMKMFEWGGENYCAITVVNPDQVMWYKRSVINENGLTDPYELYRAGNWTWDTFLEMCDKFSDPDNNKFCVDGWQVPDRIVSTTGVPFISIEDGKLKSNLFNADIERAMNTIIDTLYKQNYRYPRHELNGWGINLAAWVTGDTLFMCDLTTALSGDSFQAYIKRYKWEENEVFFVPFPKDPQSDKYYQTAKIDSYMLCDGSQNTAGFNAWTQCILATQYDEETARISREQQQTNYVGFSDEICDFLDEIQYGGVFSPVFDFKGGIGQDIVDSNTVYNPVDCLTQIPYLNCLDVDNNPATFATLRAANEGRIMDRVNEINASIGS
ncbi:MAG: ABC transporter substrate-binding protein [Bacteroides sp.]|nr:ABC transporter substrate-binding protein [Bacteroides sp.]